MVDDQARQVESTQDQPRTLAQHFVHAFRIPRRGPNPPRDSVTIQWSAWGRVHGGRAYHAVEDPIESSRCLECGYPLHGLAPDARCPECGTTRTDATLALKDRIDRRRSELRVAAWSLAGLIVLVEFGMPFPCVVLNGLPVLAYYYLAQNLITNSGGRWRRAPFSILCTLICSAVGGLGVPIAVHLGWLATSGIAHEASFEGATSVFYFVPFVALITGMIGAAVGLAIGLAGEWLYDFAMGRPLPRGRAMIPSSRRPALFDPTDPVGEQTTRNSSGD